MQFARALLVCAIPLFAGVPAGAQTGERADTAITGARYSEPTTRYDHAILGDDIEWGALVLDVDTCAGCTRRAMRVVTIRLPQTRVFEDVAPRLADLDGDGHPEVIVVESDLSRGARLAVYDENGVRAATPFIGRPHRWLAPVGAADLDGDGFVEIAYVDRPHLAKVLRVWRFADDALTLVAEAQGYANHRIGETDISGGVRDCGSGPEMIVATADWRALVAAQFENGEILARVIAAQTRPADFDAAMGCDF